MNISECSLLALKCQDRHTKILHQRALSHKLYLFLGRILTPNMQAYEISM